MGSWFSNHLHRGFPRSPEHRYQSTIWNWELCFLKPLELEDAWSQLPDICCDFHDQKWVCGCPRLLSVAMVNTITKSSLGKERVYFTLCFQIHHWGEVTAVARAGIEAETMSAYWLVLWLTRFLLQHSLACPRNGTAHSGLCPSASVISQDTLLQT